MGLVTPEVRRAELGVIITDSHTIPLRRGVLGISLAHYGFAPLKDYRGNADIFGRTLKMTQTNIPDGLAAAAVVLMGEGAERTPLALITDVPWVKFEARPAAASRRRPAKPFSSFEIKTHEDLYYPLLVCDEVEERKGRKGVIRGCSYFRKTLTFCQRGSRVVSEIPKCPPWGRGPTMRQWFSRMRPMHLIERWRRPWPG